VNINEGREIVESDLRCRMRHLERGGMPECPERCLVWARGILPRGEEDQPVEKVRRLAPARRGERSFRNLSGVPLHPEGTP
jgi:hypothetical protein